MYIQGIYAWKTATLALTLIGRHLFLGERSTFLARRTALLFISVSDKRVRNSSELRKLGHVAYTYDQLCTIINIANIYC